MRPSYFALVVWAALTASIDFGWITTKNHVTDVVLVIFVILALLEAFSVWGLIVRKWQSRRHVAPADPAA